MSSIATIVPVSENVPIILEYSGFHLPPIPEKVAPTAVPPGPHVNMFATGQVENVIPNGSLVSLLQPIPNSPNAKSKILVMFS